MYPVNYVLIQTMTKARVVSVRMSDAMHAALVRLATKDRRPLSQFIELALEDFLRAKGEWDD
jgi:predicted transcriptional regulator